MYNNNILYNIFTSDFDIPAVALPVWIHFSFAPHHFVASSIFPSQLISSYLYPMNCERSHED